MTRKPNSTETPLKRVEEAADSEIGLVALYKPLFKGRGLQLLTVAVASFLSGMAEALVLVVLANIALSIGSSTGDSLDLGIGALEGLDLGIGAYFLVALALTGARFLLQLIAARITARMTADMIAEIRAGTFEDYSLAAWSEQSQRTEADVQDLLVRHVNRNTSAVGTMSTAMTTLCSVVALLISAFMVDPLAAVLLIVTGGVLFLILKPLARSAKRVSRMQQMAGVAYGTRSMEAISNSLEVRAFGVTGEVSRRLAAATREEARPTYTALLLKQLVQSLYQMMAILLLLGGLFAAYTFTDQPLAALGAIVVILIRALNQLGGLQNAYHSTIENAPYVERLQLERAMFRAARPRSGGESITTIRDLALNDVGYSYVEDRPALTDVSLHVNAGEAIGIIGPSGSGKSTLIQILLRLREPSVGRYLVNGVEAGDIDDESWFAAIAFVPQESNLIDDTIRANIAFYRDADDEAIIEAAKRAHIHDEIMAMPEGYDTQLGSRGGALSGGQRQRISIARALLRRPSILVLDEPTSALDMRSESLVHETFSELRGEVTVFAIAHRLSTLNSCDRIVVMEDGQVQAFGTRDELERNSVFYRDALALSQIRS